MTVYINHSITVVWCFTSFILPLSKKIHFHSTAVEKWINSAKWINGNVNVKPQLYQFRLTFSLCIFYRVIYAFSDVSVSCSCSFIIKRLFCMASAAFLSYLQLFLHFLFLLSQNSCISSKHTTDLFWKQYFFFYNINLKTYKH